MKIQQIATPAQVGVSSSQKSDGSFSDMLKNSMEKVNNLQKQADSVIEDLVAGNNRDIVQTMIAMEKADTAFRLMTQIRNKIVQAYEEVMRMQV